eukprot:scaffold77764_cov48-Attheya_sp.AAC.2
MNDGEQEAQSMLQAADDGGEEDVGDEEEFRDHEDNNDTTAVVKKKKKKKKKKKRRPTSHMEAVDDDVNEGSGDYSSLPAANMTYETLEEGEAGDGIMPSSSSSPPREKKKKKRRSKSRSRRQTSDYSLVSSETQQTSSSSSRPTAERETSEESMLSSWNDVIDAPAAQPIEASTRSVEVEAAPLPTQSSTVAPSPSKDRDVLAKQRGRRPSHMIPATTPGAVATSIREDRSTAKQTGRTPTDSAAAARAARRHTKESASTSSSSTPPPNETVRPPIRSANYGVGVIAEEGNDDGDMVTRRRPRIAPVATRPGAVGTTVDPARRKLSGPGTNASSRRANSGSSPHQSEQDERDIVTKRRAGGGRTSTQGSNNSGGGDARAIASALREDISATRQQQQQQRINRATRPRTTGSGGGGNTSVASSVDDWSARGSDYDPEWNSNGTNNNNGRTARNTGITRGASIRSVATSNSASGVQPIVNDPTWDDNDPTWDSMSVAASVMSASVAATSVAATSVAATVALADDDDAPNYPGVESDSPEGGAVEAYIADLYVEPMAVVQVMSEQEEIKQEVQKYRRYGICFACLLVVTVVSIVVPISLTLFEPKKEKVFNTESPSPMPSSVPSTSPSAAPSSIGFVGVMNAVSNITSMELFLDQSSPQYKAAKYMADEDPNGIRPVNDSRFLQRYALATFFFSTNGESWKRCNPGNLCPGTFSTWLSDSDECDWMGIFCNDDKFLIQINIGTGETSSSGLTGALPDEMGYLTTISSLLLVNNDLNPIYSSGIEGTIPATFARLTNLRFIIMWANSLISPIPDEWLSENKLLGTIWLHNNKFDGTLNTLFSSLPKLTSLVLTGNEFTGSIPPGFRNLPLIELELESNNFNSTIPEDLFNIPTLKRFLLSDNNFTGSISSDIGKLTQLTNFNVSYNSMSGSIPREFYTIDSLAKIGFRNNSFTGPILNEFTSVKLREIELQYNDFSGTVPPIFGSSERLRNSFTGSVPDEICAKVGNNMILQIQVLTADCDEINCTCCTTCYPLPIGNGSTIV